jgi:hypothetical protein
MIAILGDKAQSRGMGGRGTRHSRERMSALPLIVRHYSLSPGEGGVRANQSQGERLGFLDCHTLI